MMWKALRLPWRKDVLAGADLDGNLYFERSVRSAQRSRRHVMYKKNMPVAEYSDQTIPIQWQAWMRHTRKQPPTIQELLQDAERRRKMAENVHRLATKEASQGAVSGPEAAHATSSSHSQPQKTTPRTSPPPGESFEPEGWVPTSSRRAAARSGNDDRD
ncbi:hypothetical protein H4S02_013598 [Coemansia sp. RSA 2611]|nr:hypothetical protein H4S02_013598 [Coemansia sp. RSA 2611]KAJ2700694.1 hypothetical protein H4218_001892 [Coemansia sp. IMI 209128]